LHLSRALEAEELEGNFPLEAAAVDADAVVVAEVLVLLERQVGDELEIELLGHSGSLEAEREQLDDGAVVGGGQCWDDIAGAASLAAEELVPAELLFLLADDGPGVLVGGVDELEASLALSGTLEGGEGLFIGHSLGERGRHNFLK